MLEWTQTSANCDGLSRRAWLQVGGLSAFGLTLPVFLQRQALAEPAAQGQRNCILLFTEGGMSNVDTFDMKPEAPAEYRGEFRPIDSNVPGTLVCEHLPHMARMMDKVCLIKSIAHAESGDHVAACHYMFTGYPQRPDTTGQPVGSTIYPAISSVVARQHGWKNRLPPNVELGNGSSYSGAGYLGSAFNPLLIRADPSAADFRVEDVSLPASVGASRTERRQKMLAKLDGWQKRVEATAALEARSEFYRQAFDLMTSPAAKEAFRLEAEPAAVRDRYGRNRVGQSALLARRLIEAGVRFVTIGSGGWDTHDNNFGRLKTTLLPQLDQAWSALLDDLTERGLMANTVVACTGEFGRTPKVNGAAGRDHYAPCNVVALSGAGIRMGTTIGETDKKAERVVGTPNTTLDYAATMFELLGIDGTREYHTDDGRPVLVNNGGQPIAAALA